MAISLLSLVISVSMAATISLPDYFIFTSVDGKPVSNKSQLEVSSDQHLIELQFYEVFSSGADETHFIKSDAQGHRMSA
jgi:hypothetical protein